MEGTKVQPGETIMVLIVLAQAMPHGSLRVVKMLESVVNLKVEIVVSQLYQVGVATSYDVAQGNFDELIRVYTIFIRIATPFVSLSPFFNIIRTTIVLTNTKEIL
jgi:hypothetical protein